MGPIAKKCVNARRLFGRSSKAGRLREALRTKETRVRSILFLVMFCLPLQSSALEIERFESGLACTDGYSFGWICHDTEEIHVTGQGRCVWDGETLPCTWYGFEFDYSGNHDDITIECNFSASEAGSSGNPAGVIEDESDSGSYSFKLEGEQGTFFNPQYMLLSTRPAEKALLRTDTTCKAGDTVLFEFGFNIHFPLGD